MQEHIFSITQHLTLHLWEVRCEPETVNKLNQSHSLYSHLPPISTLLYNLKPVSLTEPFILKIGGRLWLWLPIFAPQGGAIYPLISGGESTIWVSHHRCQVHCWGQLKQEWLSQNNQMSNTCALILCLGNCCIQIATKQTMNEGTVCVSQSQEYKTV